SGRMAMADADVWRGAADAADGVAPGSDLVFIEQSGANGALQRSDVREHTLAVGCGGISVENHIAYLVVGLVVLSGNVDGVAREHFIQTSQHARQIALHLNEPRPGWPRRQLDLGEIDSAHRRPGIAVID